MIILNTYYISEEMKKVLIKTKCLKGWKKT